jgi:L-ribulose-5-phosphate 4-epimerase
MTSITSVASARTQVHDACLRMVTDGLVVASSGNISVRISPTKFVVTAGGVPYSQLTPYDHPVVSIDTGSWTGPRKPTSELALHLALFREMPNIDAIVHTHSRFAAAFAVAGLDLPFICNENIAMHAEKVLVTRYEAPGTRDLGEEVLRTFERQPGSRAVLLANHGVVAIAGDLETAYNVAAQVEWVANVLHIAATLPTDLGPARVLPIDVQDLIGRNYNVAIARETRQVISSATHVSNVETEVRQPRKNTSTQNGALSRAKAPPGPIPEKLAESTSTRKSKPISAVQAKPTAKASMNSPTNSRAKPTVKAATKVATKIRARKA